MKTNKILMAMVLAAGFTACTSEDVVESTQNVALNNRKVLGDIEFVMGGAESRFAQTEEGWVFETGDAFGAALVDVPNGEKEEDAWKNYNLTEYIQTNYQYAKGEGNVWTTPARMVEGNYVFYAPFNKDHLVRTAMETAFPITQTLDVVDGVVDPYSAINNAIKEGYPFFVDYKFLSSENQETSLSLNFKHIYAYPEIKFVNKSSDDVTLEKFVVVLPNGSEVYAKGTLNIAGDATKGLATKVAAANSKGGIIGNLFNLGTEKTATVTTGNTYGSWVKYSAVNGKTGATSDIVNDEGAAKTTHIVVEIPEGLTVEAGDEVKFNIVLPAKAYTGLTAYAMVNDEDGIKFTTGAITFAPGKRYPAADYKSTGELVSKPGDAFTLETSKDLEDDIEDYSAVATPSVIITSSEELVQAISGSENVLTVITTEGVVYGQDAVDAWDGTRCTQLVVNGDLIVEGLPAASVTATKKNLPLSDKIKVNGKTTIKNIVASAAALNDVEVAKNADFTTTKSIAGDVENKGTLVVGAKNITFNNILNEGTMTVSNAAAINDEKTLTNKGTLNIAAQLDGEIKNEEEKDGEAVYAGTINVTGEYEAPATTLDGFWNVSGKLTVAGGAALDSVMTVSGGKLYGDLTVNGYGTLKAKEGAIVYGAITLNGTDEALKLVSGKTDGVTVGQALKTAKVEAGNAIFISQIKKDGSGTAASNVVALTTETTVPGVVAGVDVQTTLTGTLSKTWTGDITKVINPLTRTLVINGDIVTTSALEISASTTGAASLSTIKVTGDITAAAGDIDLNATNVEIGGAVDAVSKTIETTATTVKFAKAVTVNNAMSLTASSATNVTFGGDITITGTGSLTLNNNAVVELAGDLSAGSLTAKDVHVNSDITIDGELNATDVYIYKNNVMTVSSEGEFNVATPAVHVKELKANNSKDNRGEANITLTGDDEAGEAVYKVGSTINGVETPAA